MSSDEASGAESDPLNTNIFVDNDIPHKELGRIFTQFGEADTIIFEGTQCSVVYHLTRIDAENNLKDLNGTEIAGQNLRLSFANQEVWSKVKRDLSLLWPRKKKLDLKKSENSGMYHNEPLEDPYNTSIFVENNVSAKELQRIFTPFGLSYVLILEGTHHGFANFSSRSCAENAVTDLNGTMIEGENLSLSFANEEVRFEAINTLNPHEPAAIRDGGPHTTCILVDNDISVEDMNRIFTPFGLRYTVILEEPQCGFANFLQRSSAEEAIRKLNGTDISGQNLRLSFAKTEMWYKVTFTLRNDIIRKIKLKNSHNSGKYHKGPLNGACLF